MIGILNRLIVLLGILPVSLTARAAEAFVMPVWPGRDPGQGEAEEKVTERGKDKPDRSIVNVRWPTLTVYLADEAKANGAAVVICPGGGYYSLAIDKEGHDVAHWLNSIGVAGIVLKYRAPHPELSKDELPWPLQDCQQTMRLVRAHAKEWKLDPKRFGIVGFSAGGHLASSAATHFDLGNPDAPDAIGKLSCRPDFMILVYPVVTLKLPYVNLGSRNNLLGKVPDPVLVERYSNDLHVTPQTPPTFLVHAKDDGVKIENSIQFYEALKKAGVPCEFVPLETGGHGFGLGIHGGEAARWPARCAEWLATQKVLDRR